MLKIPEQGFANRTITDFVCKLSGFFPSVKEDYETSSLGAGPTLRKSDTGEAQLTKQIN